MKLLAVIVLILTVVACVFQQCSAPEQLLTAAEPSEPSVDYVLNHNTKKFHYPDCASVADILPKNIEYFHGPRSLLIELGFVPCKRCNP